VSEVRLDRERSEENAKRQLDEVRRSGSGIVKRQIHRSPGLERKLAATGEAQASKRNRELTRRGYS